MRGVRYIQVGIYIVRGTVGGWRGCGSDREVGGW